MFCKNCGKEIKEGVKFCKNCGTNIPFQSFVYPKNTFKKWVKKYKNIILIGLAVVFLFWIVSSILQNDPDSPGQKLNGSFNQNKIASSVVNIFCPSINSDYEDGGGTGTIITESGVIITNSHIIPQDEHNLYTERCMVAIVNPSTGKAESLYMAEPIVLPEISDYYDLAFLRIYSAYYDEEEGEYAGAYPRSSLYLMDAKIISQDLDSQSVFSAILL